MHLFRCKIILYRPHVLKYSCAQIKLRMPFFFWCSRRCSACSLILTDPFYSLSRVIQFRQVEGAEIEQFILFDDDALICAPFSEDESLKSAQEAEGGGEDEDNGDDDTGEGVEPVFVTRAEGLNALQKVRGFMGLTALTLKPSV